MEALVEAMTEEQPRSVERVREDGSGLHERATVDHMLVSSSQTGGGHEKDANTHVNLDSNLNVNVFVLGSKGCVDRVGTDITGLPVGGSSGTGFVAGQS